MGRPEQVDAEEEVDRYPNRSYAFPSGLVWRRAFRHFRLFYTSYPFAEEIVVPKPVQLQAAAVYSLVIRVDFHDGKYRSARIDKLWSACRS